MKITEEKLKDDLIQIYTYHFKQAVDKDELRDSKNPEEAYEIGKHDGAVEAIEAVMLQVFGGKQLFEIWQKTMRWANDGKIPDDDEVN